MRPEWQTGRYKLAGRSKGHRAISKILFPLDFYTLIEQNIFFPWMSYFSTICDLNSHIVDSDEILVAKIHQNYQSHNRMTKSFSGLPSISPSSNNEVVYNGPFIGRARALVDYTPSPYDRDALRFNVSQVFKVI